MSYQLTFITTKVETIQVESWEEHFIEFKRRLAEEVKKFPDHSEADLRGEDILWQLQFLRQRGVSFMIAPPLDRSNYRPEPDENGAPGRIVCSQRSWPQRRAWVSVVWRRIVLLRQGSRRDSAASYRERTMGGRITVPVNEHGSSGSSCADRSARRRGGCDGARNREPGDGRHDRRTDRLDPTQRSRLQVDSDREHRDRRGHRHCVGRKLFRCLQLKE